MTDDYERLDATDQAALVRDGEVTATELVEAAIARLEARNPALNAVIHPALDRARTVAQDSGSGPLAGVPFLTKDLVCHEAGLPFHEGNAHLREIGWTADVDQVLATRFREAGLVSLGRTNTPEFGMRPVCEPVAYGPTNNPWNLDHNPGGSSGGSAAAVAAGIVPVAHGNDVGGSIRAPASHCGLVGLKPSRGRSCMAPDFFDAMGGLAEELVVSRSVRDTAAVLDAVSSRPHIGDWHPTWPASESYTADAATDPGRLRIGFVAEHDDIGVDPDVRQSVRSIAEVLTRLGHDVTEDHPAALDEDLGPLALPHYAAGAAWMIDHHWPRKIGHPLPDDQIEPTNQLLREIGRSVTGPALLEARELAQAWTRRLLGWWEDRDILVCPVVPTPPPRTGDDHDDTHLIAWCAPFNVSGQPAMAIPATVVDGLPIGVQLVAAHGREDLLIRLAAQLEQETGWLDRRPPAR
ncbi:MAG: amidase [Acidimicrobiales bacterium]|nr:amidase [Acidimicrobiales bacterium]